MKLTESSHINDIYKQTPTIKRYFNAIVVIKMENIII